MPIEPFYVMNKDGDEDGSPELTTNTITPFEDIYCMNESMRKFREVSNSNPLYYYLLMNQFLKNAIGSFPECQKDLTSRIDMDYNSYKFTGNGVDNEFLLDPAPPFDPNMDNTLYVTVDGVELNEDEYETRRISEEVTLILDEIPDDGVEIYCESFIIGYFDIADGLSILEKQIIAQLMNQFYIQRIINDDRLLTYTIYSKDENAYSQANHVRNTGEWLRQLESETRKKIWRYEWSNPVDGISDRT